MSYGPSRRVAPTNLLSEQSNARKQQRGAVLAVALILLLALTVLGVAALNGNKLQTRLSYNAAESTKAFQAAESALAAGEIFISAQKNPPAQGCTSTGCPTSTSIWDKTTVANTATLSNLLDSTWWMTNGRKYGYTYQDGTAATLQANQEIPGAASAPAYIVQYLGTATDGSLDSSGAPVSVFYYEVSAKGTGALSENNTVVQSVFAVRY